MEGEIYPGSLRVLAHHWNLQVQQLPRADAQHKTGVEFARLFKGETYVRITPIDSVDVYEGYAEIVQYVPDVSMDLRGLDDLKLLERATSSGLQGS
ncbi:hypothetical protein DES52_1191 [Deinococcus yavapaiensis KR-236]|uniref:Uncharacterized protein n=2 Tax=Deinococcus TaxID=1298 RepID=A0A318SH51_9DEIO|nr:hypothetical protein DES52_1191 [Deinococcus yavapaiensis KR-236]